MSHDVGYGEAMSYEVGYGLYEGALSLKLRAF